VDSNKFNKHRAEVMNKKISVHHIGGRKSGPAFPTLASFEKDIINVLYDADEECIEQIKQINDKGDAELYVFPYCFSDLLSSSTFNINYDPYTSSLYKFNPYYKSHYYFDGVTDYVFGETCKTMEEREVDLVTLDHLFHQVGDVPKPDFLSLDTQGSEWDILTGGQETLKSSVLAIGLEVEFHPLYQGQKLFGDISHLLFSLGFQFVKFEYLGISSPYRAAVGLRGDGFQTSGDALYFKKIEHINGESEIDHFFMLQKMAFIAIAYNQFEYGLQCLEMSKELGLRSHLSTEEFEVKISYCKFLRDLQREIERTPKYFPMTFAESCTTFEASKSRFKASVNTQARWSVKEWLRKIPILFGILKKMKLMVMHVKASFSRNNVILFIRICCVLRRYSMVEKVLLKYGLKKQADCLLKNRLIQSKYVQSKQ